MIRYNAGEDLLVFYPSGTFGIDDVEMYYRTVAKHQPDGCTKRFVDLDEPDRIDFGYEEMGRIAQLADRSSPSTGKNVRIVLHATQQVARGVANMVSTLVVRENYDIKVCSNLDEAAAYLEVDKKHLLKD